MTAAVTFSEAAAWQSAHSRLVVGTDNTVLVALDLSCMASIVHSSDIRHSWPPISCCINDGYCKIYAEILVPINLGKRKYFYPLPT